MSLFAVRRIARMLFIVFSVVTVTFFMARSFANPLQLALGVNADPEVVARLSRLYGFDRSIVVQYVTYLGDVLRGDFGISLWQRLPAIEIVLQRLPYTLTLSGTALVVAGIAGFGLGFAAGMRPGSWTDRLVSVASSAAISVPDFFFGIVLIVVFSVRLGLLPTGGTGRIDGMIMPVLALALLPAGRLARVTRGAVIAELSKPYVLAARARGLSRAEVMARHVVKAVVPVSLTVAAYDFLQLFTGRAFAVEALFAWPGIALLAVESVVRQDVILMSAVVIVAGGIIAVVNTALDLLYHVLDKRVSV